MRMAQAEKIILPEYAHFHFVDPGKMSCHSLNPHHSKCDYSRCHISAIAVTFLFHSLLYPPPSQAPNLPPLTHLS